MKIFDQSSAHGFEGNGTLLVTLILNDLLFSIGGGRGRGQVGGIRSVNNSKIS